MFQVKWSTARKRRERRLRLEERIRNGTTYRSPRLPKKVPKTESGSQSNSQFLAFSEILPQQPQNQREVECPKIVERQKTISVPVVSRHSIIEKKMDSLISSGYMGDRTLFKRRRFTVLVNKTQTPRNDTAIDAKQPARMMFIRESKTQQHHELQRLLPPETSLVDN